MCKNILKPASKKKILPTIFLIMCSMYISANALARNHWDRSYMQISFSDADTAIGMRFKFFDYVFGPANENGYLEYCDFSYSTDGVNFTNFMRSETSDQSFADWSWVIMKNKLAGTRLQFDGCYSPPAGTMWSESIPNYRVEVNNTLDDWAWLTIRWFLDTTYKNVYFIRIVGKWCIKGVWPDDYFDEVYAYEGNKKVASAVKSKTLNVHHSPFKHTSAIKNAAQIYKESDAIVIKGAMFGENVNVYSTSGVLIKSIVTNKDIIKINLPANHIYIVNIGQVRKNVAL